MKKLVLTGLCVLFASTVAMADWNVGDPYKMHFPQLPDPCGWDVFIDVTGTWGERQWESPSQGIGDDWLCTETGPVSDIHFWMSWHRDNSAVVEMVTAQIYSNEPEGPGGYSQPKDLLWEDTFQVGEFTERWYGSGEQGWYDPWYPGEPLILPRDHENFYQINIQDIEDPFIQNEGEIYWLVLGVDADGPAIGWKTSLNQWGDDAVYMMDGTWLELFDPITWQSMDMAFVITPEPATICLLGLGALFLVKKKRG